MEEKNKKIILSSLIAVLVIVVIVIVVMITINNKNQIPQQQTTQQEKQVSQDQQITPEDEITPLTEEKKEELAAIKVTTGTLTSVDIAKITVSTPEGELELNVPQEGASFVTQTTQEDGSFLIEEVGLFELPTDKEVEIQYNSSTNTVMLVTVK